MIQKLSTDNDFRLARALELFECHGRSDITQQEGISGRHTNSDLLAVCYPYVYCTVDYSYCTVKVHFEFFELPCGHLLMAVTN